MIAVGSVEEGSGTNSHKCKTNLFLKDQEVAMKCFSSDLCQLEIA